MRAHPMSHTRDKVAALAPLLERVNRAFCWRVFEDGPRRIDEPLGDDKVAAHVLGRERYGACPMAPGTEHTRLALLDFDDHEGTLDPAQMRETVELVASTLRVDGYEPIAWRSSGGRGVHLFLLFEEPQDAHSVREFLKGILERCGLSNGTKGVVHQQTEVFPKNAVVPRAGFGSMFVLPGAGKSEPLAGVIEWPTSPPVPHVERPAAPERVQSDAPEIARLQSALDAIPNEGEGTLSYEDWRDVIFAVHYATEGSDAGLDLAHAFSSRAPKYDPDFLESRVWPYINADRAGARVITERTLFLKAAAHGWQDPEIDEAFEVLETPSEPLAQAPPNRTRFAPVQAALFAQGKPPSWLVKGVIPRADLIVVYGDSGSGKSFFVLDLSCALAQGEPWRGCRTVASRVVYIAAEGAGGFRNRLSAYEAHFSVPLDLLDVAVISDAPNFLLADDIKALIEALKGYGGVDFIVVDTWAQVTPGANENAGEDMGRALAHCRALRRATGATVCLIHHSGKDASKGARGWSGLRAAADAEIEVLRADEDRVATVTKLKDGNDGSEFGFKLRTVPIGMDDDGEIIESCVVEPTQAVAKEKKRALPKGAREKTVWQVIIDLKGIDGATVSVDEVLREAVNRTPRDPQSTGRDTRRQHAMRALDSLIERGTVKVEGGIVHVAEAA
jgi:hypothetical protein